VRGIIGRRANIVKLEACLGSPTPLPPYSVILSLAKDRSQRYPQAKLGRNLGLPEKGIEVRQHVRRVPLLESDELAGYFAVAIDDVSLGVH